MKEIRLFDYQQEMLRRVQEAFRKHQSVMVQMPTGTGKTYLLAAIVKGEGQRVKTPCVWIVAHRRELVAQIEETLAKFDLPLNTTTQHSTLNPQLSTLNSQPSTLNPQPSTLNSQLSTPASQLSTLNPQLSTLNPQLSTLNPQPSTLNPQPSTLIRVMSIQWLTLHYGEMKEAPSLIVIDEAHHAVASTYAEVMRAFPKAKKLGLTATPYRLSGDGFTDLFDVLLTSWSVERFIAKGRLSLYDYYSIKPDGQDQRLIDSLKKRGADGDYQQRELSEVMDVRPSLERLCMTVKRYVPKKKGIVYAFSIEHAEHIAEFYRENGINAVALSSNTPLSERKSKIGQFKKGEIRVLVSVDLFSEGFDCPDVQFVQLARPTLSLSKYLQMVGRGLRVARRKSYCVILDNVGLYRRFGMPSADRDWQRLFEGRSQLADSLQEVCMRVNNNFCHWGSVASEDEEMMKILGHDRQKKLLEDSEIDEIVEDKDGWTDRRSGLRFAKRPQTVSLLGVEFCTEDGVRFFPRIRSKFIDDKAYVNLKSLELQVGRGINWKRRLISLDEPNKVYQLKDKAGSVRLYVDDEENFYAQGNPDMELTPIHTQEDMNAYCQRYSKKEKAAAKRHEKVYKHGLFYPIHNSKVWERDEVQKGADEIWYVPKDVLGESYWVDGISGLKHYTKPVAEQRGFVYLLKEGDWHYVRNIPVLRDTALRNWQIVADDNICVINGEFLFLKQEPRLWFKILKKTDDFSYFVVKEYKNFYGYASDSEIFITQDNRRGLRMESNGVPYIPHFQTASRAESRKYNL